MSYLRDKEKTGKGDKPWYRVYGLKDYKRMQNEVRLGTRALGPDLDNETFKERVSINLFSPACCRICRRSKAVASAGAHRFYGRQNLFTTNRFFNAKP